MAESKNIVIGSVEYSGIDPVPLKAGKYIDLHTKGKRFVEDIKISVTAKEYDGSVDIEGEPSAPGEGTEIYLQEKTITQNGEYTADSGYDGLGKVTVNVPIPDGYIKPSGTKSITENGTHDVTDKAMAVVSVPIPDGYVHPSGGLSIAENGTYDVTHYARVNVNVPGEVVEIYDGSVIISGGTSLISFTIDGVSYQAEEGMNFYQWANSDYNTGGFVNGGEDYYVGDSNGTSYVQYEGEDVLASHIIIEGYAYGLAYGGN